MSRASAVLLALLAGACDPGYSVARWAGAPIDKTTYHEVYGWGEAAGGSTREVLSEIRKPCREERIPFFIREYFRRTSDPAVISELPRLVCEAKRDYVPRIFSEQIAEMDHNVPRERLAEWQAALRRVLASPKLRPLHRPAFEAALDRAEADPAHFRSLVEDAARKDRKAEEKSFEAERKAEEKRRKEAEKRRKEAEKKNEKEQEKSGGWM